MFKVHLLSLQILHEDFKITTYGLFEISYPQLFSVSTYKYIYHFMTNNRILQPIKILQIQTDCVKFVLYFDETVAMFNKLFIFQMFGAMSLYIVILIQFDPIVNINEIIDD